MEDREELYRKAKYDYIENKVSLEVCSKRNGIPRDYLLRQKI